MQTYCGHQGEKVGKITGRNERGLTGFRRKVVTAERKGKRNMWVLTQSEMICWRWIESVLHQSPVNTQADMKYLLAKCNNWEEKAVA